MWQQMVEVHPSFFLSLIYLNFLSRSRQVSSSPAWLSELSQDGSSASPWSRWRTTTTTGSSSRTGAGPAQTVSRLDSTPWWEPPPVWVSRHGSSMCKLYWPYKNRINKMFKSAILIEI